VVSVVAAATPGVAEGGAEMIDLTPTELRIVDEIVGGRFDALVDLLEGNPKIPNAAQLKADIETLRPIVEKLRS
jgi:hypothetical protein